MRSRPLTIIALVAAGLFCASLVVAEMSAFDIARSVSNSSPTLNCSGAVTSNQLSRGAGLTRCRRRRCCAGVSLTAAPAVIVTGAMALYFTAPLRSS